MSPACFGLLGLAALAIDLEGSTPVDITDRKVLELICGWISAGVVAGIFLATPCLTLSRARFGRTGRPGGPLRAKTHAWQCTMRASVRIVDTAVHRQVAVGLENPDTSLRWPLV